MSIIKTVVVWGVITALVLLLASWIAGGVSGTLFGLMIAIVIAVKMGGYLGLFPVPPVVKKLTNWVVFVSIASISIIWISGAVGKQLQESQVKKSAQFQPRAAIAAEKFDLKVGERMPTVEVGAGTRHVLASNKSYVAISIQSDGSEIRYPMSIRETWN